MLVLVFYGIFPIAGAIYNRFKWAKFRRRFDELRLRPLLDYGLFRQLGAGTCPENVPGDFRFIGDFESITDGLTLWVQGDNLTMPVSLAGAEAWLLPMQWGDLSAKRSGAREGEPDVFDPGEDAPERVRWNRIATFTEGARVFVGGNIRFQDERWGFVSSRDTPLLVIFFDCGDRALASRAIRSSRQRNEYWNGVTPYSLALGALSLVYIAWTFLNRPMFRLTVIIALIALFVPLMPWIPPGLLCTVLYRRLSWQARKLRAASDLARLPLRYLGRGKKSVNLPSGERYGYVKLSALPEEKRIPLLLPGSAPAPYSKSSGARGRDEWYVFGALGEDETPVRPEDPFATFGALPGKPETLVRRYAIRAYALEAAAWLILLAGIGLNILFVITLIRLL
jgi:hypothetical protein